LLARPTQVNGVATFVQGAVPEPPPETVDEAAGATEDGLEDDAEPDIPPAEDESGRLLET
jgi:hypothetical protein